MRLVPRLLHSAAFAACLLFASAAGAETVIWGGPTWNSITQTGYWAGQPDAPVSRSPGNGVAGSGADRFDNGFYVGARAVRWDASGAPAVELGHLGTSGGFTSSNVFCINPAGTAVGFADRFGPGVYLGSRAVRWEASGTAATELGHLGTDSAGFTRSAAFAVNTAGTAVGQAYTYVSGSNKGNRAVRWNAASTGAIELANLGTDSSGVTDNLAYDVNDAGTAVGYSQKHVGGLFKGERAVRWNAAGPAATELGNLGTDSDGFTRAYAYAVNTAGAAVGWAWRYEAGVYRGNSAVRWDASGTAATELGNLGTSSQGHSTAYAHDINAAGTAVGISYKYEAGVEKGTRAVRWDASGTAAFELGLLGTDAFGKQDSYAAAINSAGIAVGHASYYLSNTGFEQRAVVWGLDGAAIDLNTLIDPDSGWTTLYYAHGISDTNWVTGVGYFDPGGGQEIYGRAFLLDISSVVPEPGGVALLTVAFRALLCRRRRRQH
jgi:hypothetical protein